MKDRASLVAQWQRVRHLMHETRVPSLVQEDPTCLGAAKPPCTTTIKPGSRAQEPQLLKPEHLEPVLCNKGSHCNEKPFNCN